MYKVCSRIEYIVHQFKDRGLFLWKGGLSFKQYIEKIPLWYHILWKEWIFKKFICLLAKQEILSDEKRVTERQLKKSAVVVSKLLSKEFGKG